MKRIIILFAFALTFNTFNAQVFFENWDFPQAWTTNDADGDGNDWFRADLSLSPTFGFGVLDTAVISQSFDATNNVALTPDNYLFSPSIDLSSITGNIQLNFDVAASSAAPFEAENYAVYVVTDISAAAMAVAIPIFSETILNGNQVINHTFDISSFAGQSSVFLVFQHHNCTDMDFLILDNIGVYNADFSTDIVAGTACNNYTFTDLSVGATTWNWDFGPGATPATANTPGPHVVNYSTAGTKTAVLTTDGIATQTYTNLINVTLLDDATFSYSQTNFCLGSANELASITGAIGGVFSSTTPGFVIDASTGEIDLSSAVAATYDVTYTTPLSACQNTSTISITVGLDDATFSYSQTNFCLGSANELASITGIIGGVFSSTTPGFVIDANTGEIDLSTSVAATYDVTYTTPLSACQNTSTISITVGIDDATFSYSTTQFCFGSPNEIATVTGVAGGTFSSTNPAFVIDNTTGEIGLSTIPAGTYDVTYATPAGVCQNSSILNITILPNPTVDNIPGSLDQTLCVGAMTNPISILGTGTGFGTLAFDWTYTTVPPGEDIGLVTPGSGDIPAFLTLNTTGSPIVATFVITPTDGTCSGANPFSFTITVNPLDDASFGYAQNIFCFGHLGEALAFVTLPGGTFSSTTPGFVDLFSGVVNITFSPVNTYDVTYTSAGSCPNSSTLFIDIIDLPTVNPILNQFSCENAMTTDILFTGTGTTYDWTYTNATADNIGIAFAGTGDILSFLAQNTSGASLTSTFTVIPQLGTCTGNPVDFDFVVEQNLIVDPILDITDCENNTINLIPLTGNAAATFDWTNSDPTIGIAASGSGDIAAFTASNGTVNPITATIDVVLNIGVCSSLPESFDITVNPLVNSVFTISAPSACSNGSNPLTTLDPAATIGGTFSSTLGLAINPISGQIDLAASLPGIYTIDYAVGNAPCISATSVDFEVIETPVILPILPISVCSGTVVPDVPISMLSTYAIDWTNDNVTTGIVNVAGLGDISSFIASNPTLGGLPQISTITLTADNNGCVSDPVTFTVTVNSNPVVNAGPDIVRCEGIPITLSATGSVGTVYTWDNAIVDGVPFNKVNGNYTFTVTGTLNTCTTIDQVAVLINQSPVVTVGPDVVACEFSDLLLTGNGATTITWNNGVINNVPFVPFVSGNYIATGINQFGCTDSDTLVVTIEALPISGFTQTIFSGCSPSTVIFTDPTITNACVYSFSDGTTAIGNVVSHTFTQTGVYDVTITEVSPNGCVGATTVAGAFVLNPDPVASFNVVTPILSMINPTTSFNNTSTGAILYEWSFGDVSNPVFGFEVDHTFPADAAGNYTVRLIAETQFGCVDTAYADIILEESLLFYIPNSFTPNADEFNNKFQPVFYSGLDPQIFNMKIYNRLGQLIFETNDADYGWDGDHGAGNGLAESGVYTFKIEFSTATKDEKKLVVGNVNLIR